MKNAIIIFVRNPELGKVKTRLAEEIGDEPTLQVYKKLLQHTHDIACSLECDKFVYYADHIAENDLWEDDLFEKKRQEGAQLGDKMMLAFVELFEQGYSKLVIIGSDCPGLTTQLIEEAFAKHETSDVVIGPSRDGGYYLLGLAHLIPELFKNKKWSTGTVLADTIRDTFNLRKTCSLLPELWDIDTAEDLDYYRQMQKV